MDNAEENKLLKKKKKGQLVADSIDNTAPVRKILDDLFQKNPLAFSLYNQTIKQRRTTTTFLQNYHFAVSGHPLYAFNDDWDGQLSLDYFERFGYKSFSPKMITSIQNIDKTDPVTAYLKVKHDWLQKCKNFKKTAYISNALQKYETLTEDVVRCPKHLVDMAAHLDSDPDPHFNSTYNWYYAGHGNMQLVCVNWVDYILHSEFSCVYLNEFNKVENVMNAERVTSFDCGEGNNIFETICSSHNIIVLRTKHKVFILKIVVNDDRIQFEMLKAIESELPYTGISFDSFHKNILYVTKLDQVLTIVNLDRMTGKTVKLKSKLYSLVDNWNVVTSTHRGFYVHITRSTISMYDKRSNNVTCMWADVRHITDELKCNDISAAKLSEIAPVLYLATDHHLFLMDLRYQDNRRIKAVQRWTHGMQCVPTYISKCNFEMNKDLICLSSQWCEDICVVPNFNYYAMETPEINLTIPYRPPSILDTLKEARQNKLCFDLYNPIDNRLHTAISGCLILEQGEKYDILLQNSLGDVTCHTMFPEHFETFIHDDSLQNLHDWSTSYKQPQKDFVVSSVLDISYLWKRLKKVPESYLTGDMETLMRDKNRFDEKEIFDAFENEELDSGLLEIWVKNTEGNNDQQTSKSMNLHFSDSE